MKLVIEIKEENFKKAIQYAIKTALPRYLEDKKKECSKNEHD